MHGALEQSTYRWLSVTLAAQALVSFDQKPSRDFMAYYNPKRPQTLHFIETSRCLSQMYLVCVKQLFSQENTI